MSVPGQPCVVAGGEHCWYAAPAGNWVTQAICLWEHKTHLIYWIIRAYLYVHGRKGHCKDGEECPVNHCSETNPILKAGIKRGQYLQSVWLCRYSNLVAFCWGSAEYGLDLLVETHGWIPLWEVTCVVVIEVHSSGFAIKVLYEKSFSFFYLQSLPGAGGISVSTCVVLCTMRLWSQLNNLNKRNNNNLQWGTSLKCCYSGGDQC